MYSLQYWLNIIKLVDIKNGEMKLYSSADSFTLIFSKYHALHLSLGANQKHFPRKT